MPKKLRIAMLGFSLESNRNAPVSDRQVFEQTLYIDSSEIQRELDGDRLGLPGTVRGFCARMDEYEHWTPVPVLLAEAPPGGPIDHGFFCSMLDSMRSALESNIRAHGPLDGVYISEHGAGLSTEEDDADGAVFSMVRSTVGDDVPVIATLDLHGHVTPRMNDSADVLVAYLTNPHIDQLERGREAAEIMLEMSRGMRPVSKLVKVPMISPAVSLLTASGPYADLINYGQTHVGEEVLNVSILAGFAPADATTNGMSVVVATREDERIAQSLANELATRAWSERHRYVADLTPLDTAVDYAQQALSDPNLPAVLLADVADNPGGGGRGNTTYLLEAVHQAKLRGVVIGMMFDPALAGVAHSNGLTSRFNAHFNSEDSTRFTEPYHAEVEVEYLLDEPCVGRRGIYAGRRVDLGQCALLNLDGIRILVVSRRHQCADPLFLERMGINLADIRVLVLKSRGHFRAGFDEFFKREQIVEVDAPGLTTPNLAKLNMQNVPRPVYPLDPQMDWSPTEMKTL